MENDHPVTQRELQAGLTTLEERLLDHMRQIETNLLTRSTVMPRVNMPAYIPSKQPIRSCGSEWTHWKTGSSRLRRARGYNTRSIPASLRPSAVTPPIRTSTIRFGSRGEASAIFK